MCRRGAVVYAYPTGLDTATCTKADPCSIAHAFAVASGDRHTIKLEPGSYTASIAPTNGVFIVDGRGATLTAPTNAPAFVVAVNVNLTLFGLSIVEPNTGVNANAIECVSGSAMAILALDHVTIDTEGSAIFNCGFSMTQSVVRGGNPAAAPFIFGLTSTIDRSLFDGGNGLVFDGATTVAHITNSVVANQTGTTGAFSGAEFLGGEIGSLNVSFSTVINSKVICGSTGSPVCAGGTSAGTCLDNSVVFNGATGAPADTFTGAACTANHTLVFPQATTLAGANNKPGVNPMLKDPGNGDYHLKAGSPAIDAADPIVFGTPDFDGTPRPQGPRSDMGAFELRQ
jgi:hypothetical protein